MPAKTNNVKIGIFVLLALALLVAGLLAFGAKSYFTPKTKFETAIEGDVAGLSVGSSVQLRGVPIGKVTRITFCWHAYPQSKSRALVVEFEIDGDLMPWPPIGVKTVLEQAISNGLRAMVKSQGITGTSILSLEGLEQPPVQVVLDYTPRYYYIPSAPAQFTRMLESLEKSLQNIQQLDISSIGKGITNALAGVRLLSDKVDNLDLQSIVTNANALISEYKNAALKLEDTVGQIQETLKGMKLDQLSQNADGLVTSLRDSSARLQTLLAKVNSLPLHDAVADLQQALQTLDTILVELKRYPSGFFLGEPPPRVKGLQPVGQLK